MTTTKYDFSISGDFLYGKLASDSFTKEIQDSDISRALIGITTSGDAASVWFKDALTHDDVDILDQLVAHHAGQSLPSIAQVVTLDSPTERDKKPVVTLSPATEGFVTWLCGAGDDPNPTPPASGRGTGTPLAMHFTGSGTQTIDIEFIEPIEIHDGQIVWSEPKESWTMNDKFSVGVVMPATSASFSSGSTGNANKVSVGPGANMFVPAAGNGSWNIDLTKACPVEDRHGQGGYWDVDYNTGATTPRSTPAPRAWFLFDFANVGWLLRNIQMGHPLGVFDIEVYKVEYFHPSWRLRWQVEKVTSGSGDVSGWIFAFRRFVQ